MAISDNKITDDEILLNHVQSAPDRPTGGADEVKKIFDNLPELIAERHNDLIDDIEGGEGLELTENKVTSISASSTDVQYPSAKCVYDEISTKVLPSTVANMYLHTNATTGALEWIAGTGSVNWGSVGGTLAQQADLASALDGKLSVAGGTLTGQLTADATAQSSLNVSQARNISAGTTDIGEGASLATGQIYIVYEDDE